MGTFNTQQFNGGQFNGGVPAPSDSSSLTDFAQDALYDLNCLVPGQAATDDHLNAIRRAANQMLSAWLIDKFMVVALIPTLTTLQVSKAQYQCGPGADIDPRPTRIDAANIILGQGTSKIRRSLRDYRREGWENIAVRDIPNSLPQGFYYDGNFDIDGMATLNLWPAPDQAYSLETFAWSQLQQFADNTTQYGFPPGYDLMIRKNLAVTIAPMMRSYWKIKLSEPLIRMIENEARVAKAAVQSYNAPAPLLGSDPAFTLARRGGWDYTTGDFRWGR